MVLEQGQCPALRREGGVGAGRGVLRREDGGGAGGSIQS